MPPNAPPPTQMTTPSHAPLPPSPPSSHTQPATGQFAVDPEVTPESIAELERLAAQDLDQDQDQAATAMAAAAAAEAEEAESDDEAFTFASLFTDVSDSEEEEVVDDALLIANCGLSPITIKALEEKGIKAMFPIQKMVFEPAFAGSDLIARAKTGSGKTLAFALPVVEKIMAQRGHTKGRAGGGAGAGKGRNPLCIVLAPTRELAKQVEREFTSVAPSLFVGCYYGGTSISTQLRELRGGVDVVVGTPGRIIDLIDQNALDLSEIQFVVLDEADQMLNVGFEQDVETILNNVPEVRQTMLFSATVPKWVRKLVKQYLNEPLSIDLVGEGQSGKMADSITALAVQVTDAARRSVLVDLLTVYGDGGKAIVFTQTKRDADEVAAAVALHLPCEPLHGDMAQAERERVMASFRAGRTLVLVATDVAARGLDIPAVDLVVHYELPRDPEAFLHRSGRTGRAGRSGTAIAMYTGREIGYFKRIIRETETTNVTVVTPPSPQQVVEAAAKQVMYRLDGVDEEVRAIFAPVARTVLASSDPQEALEAALAALSGIKQIPEPRSLLTLQEGYVTLQVMSAPGRIVKPGNVAAIVSRVTENNDAGSNVGKIRMLSDGKRAQGAAFDVPKALANEIIAKKDELTARGVELTVPTTLPPEEGLYDSSPRRGSGPGGGRGRYGDDDFFEKRRLREGQGRDRRSGGGGGRGGGGGGWSEGRRSGGGGGGGGWSEGRRTGGGGGGGGYGRSEYRRGGGGGGGGRGDGGNRDRGDRSKAWEFGDNFGGGSRGDGGGDGRRGGKVFSSDGW